ncbi:MAG: NifB/NifX family molybdenum-iron cluster-binding protein [Bacillota bacterium]|jgi:predicted Fe-Mo cluster-binding NifX family protein
MKICISSTGKEKNSSVDLRFGRCMYFIFCDTDNNSFKAVSNQGVNSSHGAGIAAAQQVIDEKTDVVITGNMGPNALQLISTSGIEIYQAADGSVEEVVKLFQNNKLEKINKPVPAHSGMESRK